MIRSITMRNVLSFGDEETRLELGPLTVLIGPNGCGKSNLLEVLYLLSRLPARESDASLPIVDWLWKGAPVGGVGSVEVRATPRSGPHDFGEIRHRLDFRPRAGRFHVESEVFEHKRQTDGSSSHFENKRGEWVFRRRNGTVIPESEILPGMPPGNELRHDCSMLSNPGLVFFYDEIGKMADLYEGVRLYRDINFGGNSPLRLPQRTDLPNKFLLEDGSNLALILNRLRADVSVRPRLEHLLQRFYHPASSVDVQIQGGTAQIYVTEPGWTTPAPRLSDGTMRWLTLLAVMLDPTPPALVCFDEPDLGLHPDCVSALADLLLEASERMQVVVTTHSDVLVDAFSDRPECIVVCEKAQGATTLKRLEHSELKIWLEKYSLGDLWNSGQIGGRRF